MQFTQQTVEEFLSRQTKGTANTYRTTLRAFFLWVNKPSAEVKPADAVDYNKYLQSTRARATVQRQISTLKQYFEFCINIGLIGENPFAGVKQVAAKSNPGGKILSASEINRLLTALREQSERDYIIGLLLATTGMRISEAAQLNCGDFADGHMAVTRGGKQQIIPLREDVWNIIQEYISGRKGPLSLNPSGNRISANGMRDIVEKGVKRAGIAEKVTPHWLRESFAHLASEGGAYLPDLQGYMDRKRVPHGHSRGRNPGDFIRIRAK